MDNNETTTTTEEKKPTHVLRALGEGDAAEQLFASLVVTGGAQFASQFEEAAVVGGQMYSLAVGVTDSHTVKEHVCSLLTGIAIDAASRATAASLLNLGQPAESIEDVVDGLRTVLLQNVRSYYAAYAAQGVAAQAAQATEQTQPAQTEPV